MFHVDGEKSLYSNLLEIQFRIQLKPSILFPGRNISQITLSSPNLTKRTDEELCSLMGVLFYTPIKKQKWTKIK
jgi:hypothetical protein